MKRWPAILLVASVQGAAVIAYLAVEAGRREPFRIESIREAAPELKLERADGSRFRLAELRGRRVLLHFWATWCPPCREELPVIEALESDVREEGVVVLAVALDQDWESIRRFVGRAPPRMFVRSTSIAIDRFGLGTLPDTFVITEDGTMTARIRGARDWSSPEARRIFEP